MIKEYKSPVFGKLGKDITLNDAMLIAANAFEDVFIARATLGKEKDNTFEWHLVNTKNIEYEKVFHLEKVTSSDAYAKAAEQLGIESVRIHLTVFRLGARSYFIAEAFTTYKSAPEK